MIACSSPPAPQRSDYPHAVASPAPLAAVPPATPRSEPPAPAPAAIGVVRIDGQSTSCTQVIAVHPDGGADVMCTFDRERGCGIREVGPDGEERRRTELVPGTCSQWVPRGDGGGFLVTRTEDYRELAFTALDASGKRGASTRLTSKSGVVASDASLASDGGLFAAIAFTGDVAYRGKRLGKSEFTVAGIVRFPAALDRLAWSRLFGTRRTAVASLLPATSGGGIDAVLETRGPLVPHGPMNPPETSDGSMYGGDTYGWRAERVAFDPKGKPGARQELAVGLKRSVVDAVAVDGALATRGTDPATWKRSIVTLLRAEGARDQITIDARETTRFETSSGRTWLLAAQWNKVGEQSIATWNAHEIGGTRAKIALGAWATRRARWTSIAVRDDRVVAIGTTEDPATGTPISFTALARLDAPSIDLARLALVDKLALAPGCRGPLAKREDQIARVYQWDAELAACGVPPKARVDATTYPEGGIRTFAIKDLPAAATVCAQNVVEPAFACPSASRGSMSFNLRR